jgi:hypothetical protein
MQTILGVLRGHEPLLGYAHATLYSTTIEPCLLQFWASIRSSVKTEAKMQHFLVEQILDELKYNYLNKWISVTN